MNIPKLRFREFGCEWETVKLKDICTRVARKNKDNESTLPLTISSIHGLVDQVTYFNKQVASKDMGNYYLLKNGEFAYNKSYSAGYPLGSVKRLDKYDMGALSSLYICFAPINTISSNYLVSYFESSKWHKEVSMTVAEGARNHGLLNVNVTDFFETLHKLPPIQEQQKIAEFLSAFDEKIENQQNIIKNLEQQKKGFMQKIFSQELRFKDQNGNDFPQWEEKKLGEICEMIGGGTPSKQVEEFWTGNIPWISSSDISDYSIKNIAISRYITHNAISKSATKLCPKGTICIVSRVGVGKLAVTNEELCTSQDFTNITRFEGNILFLAYLLSMRMKMEAEKTQGTSIKGITVSEIKSFLLFLPSLSEQQKIADFLSAFDEKIQTEKQILIHLQNTKKGLLQQMFC